MMKFDNLLSRVSGIIGKFSLKVKTFHLGHFRNIFYRFNIQIFKNLDPDNHRAKRYSSLLMSLLITTFHFPGRLKSQWKKVSIFI